LPAPNITAIVPVQWSSLGGTLFDSPDVDRNLPPNSCTGVFNHKLIPSLMPHKVQENEWRLLGMLLV
jgi:hypothetical protein